MTDDQPARLAKLIEDGFDRSDSRFHSIGSTLTAHGVRLNSIDGTLTAHGAHLGSLDNKVDELHRHFDVVGESLSSQIGQIAEALGIIDQKHDRQLAEVKYEIAESRPW